MTITRRGLVSLEDAVRRAITEGADEAVLRSLLGRAQAEGSGKLVVLLGKAMAAAKPAEPQPQEPEGEEDEGEETPPEGETQGGDAAPPGEVVLSPANPYDNALAFMEAYCQAEGGLGQCRWFWRGEWYRWDGVGYARISANKLHQELWQFLQSAKRRVQGSAEGTFDLVRFSPKPSHKNAVEDALRSVLFLDDETEPPSWLDGREGMDPRNVVVFANKLVDISTGKTLKPTPRLWVHDGLGFEYDPKATCGRFDAFLEQVFPGDEEAQQLVLEWLGLGMTWYTEFQKLLVMHGEPRSGKGTIAWLMEQLGGSASYVGLSMPQWTMGENSSADIIGKKNLVFPDLRLKPGQQFGPNYNPGGMDHKSLQMILSISGEDKQTVGCKYDKFKWSGRIPGRITIISNQVPNFNDASGAINNRLLTLRFTENFEAMGKADLGLKDTLRGELAGIANRVMAAYRALRSRGRFVQPRSGEGLKREIAELGTGERRKATVLDFWNEFFEVSEDREETLPCWIFYPAFRWWCETNGQTDLLRSIVIPPQIAAALKVVPGFRGEIRRTHAGDRRYVGVRLRPEADRRGLDTALAEWGRTKFERPKAWPE